MQNQSPECCTISNNNSNVTIEYYVLSEFSLCNMFYISTSYDTIIRHDWRDTIIRNKWSNTIIRKDWNVI